MAEDIMGASFEIELLKYALAEINHYRSCAAMLNSLIMCFERKVEKK